MLVRREVACRRRDSAGAERGEVPRPQDGVEIPPVPPVEKVSSGEVRYRRLDLAALGIGEREASVEVGVVAGQKVHPAARGVQDVGRVAVDAVVAGCWAAVYDAVSEVKHSRLAYADVGVHRVLRVRPAAIVLVVHVDALDAEAALVDGEHALALARLVGDNHVGRHVGHAASHHVKAVEKKAFELVRRQALGTGCGADVRESCRVKPPCRLRLRWNKSVHRVAWERHPHEEQPLQRVVRPRREAAGAAVRPADQIAGVLRERVSRGRQGVERGRGRCPVASRPDGRVHIDHVVFSVRV